MGTSWRVWLLKHSTLVDGMVPYCKIDQGKVVLPSRNSPELFVDHNKVTIGNLPLLPITRSRVQNQSRSHSATMK